jgi:DNA-binding SARP family transcriptional activator
VLPLGGAKQRSVLALLLLRANEVVSSDQLIDALWPGHPPENAPTALQAHVSRLRKALPGGAEVLVTRAPGYAILVPPARLDLSRFLELAAEGQRELEAGTPATAAERLSEALRLWRGRPLADLEDEAFAGEAGRQLAELRLDVHELRIDADLTCGRAAELVAELRELVAANPFRERLCGQLMQALYRCDRQAEALEVYADLRTRLAAELGLEPSATLQRLQKAVLVQDDGLRPTTGTAGTARTDAPSAPAIVVYARELDALGTATSAAGLAAAASGSEVILAHVAAGPELEAATAVLDLRRQALLDGGLGARIAVFSSRAATDDVMRLVERQSADLLVTDTGPDVLEPDVVALLERAGVDVALVHRGAGALRPGPILVPFGGGDHEWAAVELGARVARASDEALRLVGATGDDSDERDASRLLADASLVLQRVTGIVAVPLLAAPGGAGLVDAAADAGVLVVGLPDSWRTDGLGSLRRTLAAEPPCPLVFAVRGSRAGVGAVSLPFSRFRWSMTRPRGGS